LGGRILVGRSVDGANFNAQAKNAQNILRHWSSAQYRPSGVAFSSPEQAVADNPNVDIVRIRSNRLWRIALFATYMGGWRGIFYPGLHHRADWLALKVRLIMGRRIPVIATMEGLLGEVGDDARERRYAAVAGHEIYSQKVPGPVVRRMEALHEMADHIIAISPFLARLGTARYGAKVSMLPLGVETALFKRSTNARRGRPRVVGAGGVRAHKRPELFIELARKFPQVDFVWFGEGDLRQALRAKIGCLGLTNIDLPGAVPPSTLAREFAASDIFVLPSRNEGVPKVTQEAAAAGLAQIVFGFYEAPTVVDGHNGFVVWNDEDMTARLGTLIDDPGLVARMGRAGAEMAAAWSWDIVAPQWERRIIDVLEGRPVVEVAA
jgi:glycosyltransferase involved in cell wall biosynthesis